MTLNALPVAAMVLLASLFFGLGLWQLQRADEKQALQTEYDRRAHMSPAPLGASLQPAAELRFHRIEATGRYEPEYQILLDNRVHRGIAGYHVLTPLRLEGSDTRVLVNRGWVPLGADRGQLPDTSIPAGPVTIAGIAIEPHAHPFVLGALSPLVRKSPTVWQQLDLERYAETVPFPIQPVVVLLDPQNSAGGFVRAWSRLDAGIAVHHGYAFQWFALALATIVVYVLLVRRNRRKP